MGGRSPDIEDWEKLRHLMEYLRGDRDRPLILGADNEGMLMWYVDALFAVHPNMQGHTSGGMMERLSHFSIHQAEVENKEFD